MNHVGDVPPAAGGTKGAAGRAIGPAAAKGRRMPSCKDIGELSSQHLDIRPGLVARVRVFLHCMRCPPCRTSVRNWRILRLALQRAAQRVPDDCEGLADCAKQRMRDVIEATVSAAKSTDATPVEAKTGDA